MKVFFFISLIFPFITSCSAIKNNLANDDINDFSTTGSEKYAEEPNGYRETAYLGAVPKTLQDGEVIDAEFAKKLFDSGDTLFVDVLFYSRKPPNLPKETVWIEKSRQNIKGSIWLANVGMGIISNELEAYFKENLRLYTNGDLNKKIVFYCLPNCWLSWNAAKRAISYSYKQVYWFPGGTKAWEKHGFPTQKSRPLPLTANK